MRWLNAMRLGCGALLAAGMVASGNEHMFADATATVGRSIDPVIADGIMPIDLSWSKTTERVSWRSASAAPHLAHSDWWPCLGELRDSDDDGRTSAFVIGRASNAASASATNVGVPAGTPRPDDRSLRVRSGVGVITLLDEPALGVACDGHRPCSPTLHEELTGDQPAAGTRRPM
jgi:hypothetical protein